MIQIGNDVAWLWIAIEPFDRTVLGIYTSRDRSILIAQAFLKTLVKIYGKHPVYSDGGTWYPQACWVWNIDYIHGTLGEYSNPEQYGPLLERARKYGRPLENYMKVIPVHFCREHKELLAHCKMLLEKACLEVHPKFDKLRIAFTTAIENGEGILDKEATSHDDVFDAFRLAMKYYRFTS